MTSHNTKSAPSTPSLKNGRSEAVDFVFKNEPNESSEADESNTVYSELPAARSQYGFS